MGVCSIALPFMEEEIMYPDREIEHRHVVINAPGERRETVTETTQEVPREVSLSPAMMMAIAIVALVAIGLTFYVVSNKNANEEANRQALLEASKTQSQQPTPLPPSTQPSTQQPVIIQQPAPAAPAAPVQVQQPPIIIQQPALAQDRSSPLNDLTIQDAATKRLTDDPNLASVSALVISGRVTLTGTVNSAELTAAAEKVVKGVRGVKSVENKIEVSEP